jgi:hypothetical protein
MAASVVMEITLAQTASKHLAEGLAVVSHR